MDQEGLRQVDLVVKEEGDLQQHHGTPHTLKHTGSSNTRHGFTSSNNCTQACSTLQQLQHQSTSLFKCTRHTHQHRHSRYINL